MEATQQRAKELTKLINLASGPRTIDEFAAACEISRAHIFRMKKGTAPSKKLLKRIAEDSYVKQIGLDLGAIYEMAGYTKPEDKLEAEMHVELVTRQDNETIDLGIVTRKLMESSFSNQLLPVGEDQDVSFAFQISKGRKKTNWYFVVLSDELQDANSHRNVNVYYYNLGRLLSLQPSSGEQYTLILHNEKAYEDLVTEANSALVKANVTVALIDTDLMQITREQIMGPGRVAYTLFE